MHILNLRKKYYSSVKLLSALHYYETWGYVEYQYASKSFLIKCQLIHFTSHEQVCKGGQCEHTILYTSVQQIFFYRKNFRRSVILAAFFLFVS